MDAGSDRDEARDPRAGARARGTALSLGPVGNVADDSVGELAPGWQVEAGYDDGEAYVCAVGRYPAGASPVGCLDMAGNVWEWVEDTYGRYAPSDVLDPRAADPEAAERVVRGGSWCYPVHDCRGASRAITALGRASRDATHVEKRDAPPAGVVSYSTPG